MVSWFARRRLVRRLGMTFQHARLVGAFAFRFRGEWMLLRTLAPVDFMGETMHPFMPWRAGTSRMTDEVEARRAQQDAADPAKAQEMTAKIRKAYEPLLVKAVLWPPVSREAKPGSIPVSDVLDDIELANAIVAAVTRESLEKKTPLPGTSWRTRRLSSTRSPAGTGSSRATWPSSTTAATR